VKCRIGIDDQDPEVALDALAARCDRGRRGCFDRARAKSLAQRIVGRRKTATSAPLDYDRVYRLKAALPHVPIIINGGIGSVAEG